MFKFLLKMGDPDYPLLGLCLEGLKLMKMRQVESKSCCLYNYLIHIFGTLFLVSQYIELVLIRDNMELALRNLSFTMLSTTCVVKAWTFILWEKYWNDVIEYVTRLEKQQTTKLDAITSSSIIDYTTYARRVTYFYWCLVAGTVFTVILAPLFEFLSSSDHRYLIMNGTAPYPEIVSSWLPFEHNRGYGYWFSILEHSAVCVYGGGVVATYDSIAVVLMSFFNGQLKLLSKNCTRLFGDDNYTVGYDEAVKRIRKCHDHHAGLVK